MKKEVSMRVELILFAICWVTYIIIYFSYHGESEYLNKILMGCIAFTIYIVVSYGRGLLKSMFGK